ncbi:MAG: HAD family hydrolase [Candidatus Diapherotrites archaeon]|uniref:HAD family hydrolase n=1 Tax=Candidatus Iainarchaeum sp. TaxID=3101447 RepID=A0A8T4L0W3_9ARCH|nr:HAD family hydrolase [Candidatus Diapherotrites archaeon]
MAPEFGLLLDLTQTLQCFDFNKMWATLYDVMLETPKCESVSFDEMQSVYGQCYGLYQSGLIPGDVEWAVMMFGLLGISLTEKELMDFLKRHHATRNRYITKPVGFRETLRSLKTVFRLAVLSNGIGQWTKNDWQLLGVQPEEFFEFELYSSETRLLKPDAAFFEHALQRFGFSATQCAMVGDSYEDDVIGAHYAGIVSVWISSEDFPQSKADFMISAFEDLTKISAKIEAMLAARVGEQSK